MRRSKSPKRAFSHLPLALPAAALLLLGAVGCQPSGEGGGEAAAPSGERVESPGLGIAVAALPDFFEVASNQGEELVLEPADPEVGGRLVIRTFTPELGGVNLVEAVNLHAEEIRGREGGEYLGQRELGTQLGSAYYSRGRYDGDGGEGGGGRVEEVSVFLLHPDGDKRLDLVYSYPAGEDSGARLQDQLFGVLGEIEPLAAPVPATEGTAEGEAEPAG